MLLRQLSLLFTSICMLSACGGSSDSKPSSASSSVASSLSSSSAAPMADDEIFTDAFNPAWGAFKIFEWVMNSYASYGAGEQGYFVQWQTVPATDPAHNQVLELNYIETPYIGWAKGQIAAAQAKDLSSYETGTLSFDINVVSWGAHFGGAFAVYAECGWPCASHAYYFQVSSLNNWNHIEVPVADLIRGGLDITAVDKPFVIFPMVDVSAGKEGIRFQLDNIKWTEGTVTAPLKNTVYAEHFNTASGLGGWTFIPYLGSEVKSRAYLDRDGWLLNQTLTGPAYDSWAMEVNLDNAIDISHKQLSFQLQRHLGPEEAVIHFVAIDGQGKEAATGGILLGLLGHDAWVHLSFDVDTEVIAEAGFNPQDVRKLAVRFDANGGIYIRRSGAATLRIDEILISE